MLFLPFVGVIPELFDDARSQCGKRYAMDQRRRFTRRGQP
jgi:hypothetical protein